MLLVKGSVRWLAKKGRNEEALKNLIWVRGGDTSEVRAEFDEIVAGLQEEIRTTEVLHGRSCFFLQIDFGSSW